MKYIKIEDGKINFEVNNKEVTRKLKNDNEFKYKGKAFFYFSSFSMGYGATNKIYEITEELKELLLDFNYGWNSLSEFIDHMVISNEHLTTVETSVPAGPDSSKFRVTKSGFIRELARPDTFGVSQYSCGTYFHKAIQVGGNVSNIEEMMIKIRFILPRIAKTLKYGNSDNKIFYRESLGTNFSTYGIG